MIFDPKVPSLDALFDDPDMFESRNAWQRAGFTILDPAKPTECMVASHSSAPGYLFKKYADDISPKEQRKNYETRIEGATRLARFIEKEDLKHVVVPRKYLHELPRRFGKSSRILVVDRLDIIGKDASALHFRDITEPALRELLRVLVKFKGLDSNSKNVQFTTAGQIAFIDLENWDRRRDHDEVRLKKIGGYLSKEHLELARKILNALG